MRVCVFSKDPMQMMSHRHTEIDRYCWIGTVVTKYECIMNLTVPRPNRDRKFNHPIHHTNHVQIISFAVAYQNRTDLFLSLPTNYDGFMN